MKLTMFFLYHMLSHCLQPEAPWCVCVYVYKYTCICVCLCARETRVCLSAFCHPAIGDSFNCSMTTTRKDQKPHKSQSKLAAVPPWKASHAIITGRQTFSTGAQSRVYLTPITQLCRYPNNTAICPDRTEVSLRKIWTSWLIKQRLVAGRLIPCQNMKTMGETLIFKSSAEFASLDLHCSQSEEEPCIASIIHFTRSLPPVSRLISAFWYPYPRLQRRYIKGTLVKLVTPPVIEDGTLMKYIKLVFRSALQIHLP